MEAEISVAAGVREQPSADPLEAADVVQELYRLLLDRPADGEGVQAYAEPLARGDLAVLDIVRALAGSDEFASRRTPTTPGRPEDFESVVSESVRTVLVRDATEEELRRLSRELAEGEPASNLYKRLMDTPEFGRLAPQHRTVARNLARELISGLMMDGIGEDALSAYGDALQSGRPLSDVIGELIGSGEFARRMEASGGALAFGRLSQLAEDLVVAQLNARGADIRLPVEEARPGRKAPADQMRSMLHTLAMLTTDRDEVSRPPTPRPTPPSTAT